MDCVIFDIKRYTVHDGPGIRQTIFFKGCPLSCWWCHNPESISREIQTVAKTDRIGSSVFQSTETIGKRTTVDELFEKVLKDSVFYEESGGGVTLSGGEPALQYEAVAALARLCKDASIHTALDTSGFAPRRNYELLSEVIDLFLFDIKHIDEAEHLRYTGVSNKLIIENLGFLNERGKNICARIPIIPGINDNSDVMKRIIELIKKHDSISEVYLLPYHPSGRKKYQTLGKPYLAEHIAEPSKEYMDDLKQMFENNGLITKIY